MYPTTHSEIAVQWHTTKNKILTQYNITAFSNKKAHWKCSVADDHEWEALIFSRAKGANCPYCAGKKIVESNCLATTHPELANQWHPTKNRNLTPHDVTAGRAIKIWWKCSVADDHEWESTIFNRTNGNNCPCCSGKKVVLSNCLTTTHPELAQEWHPTKNGELTPYNVTYGSNKKIYWKCDVVDGHEWETEVLCRTRGNGCSHCNESKGERRIRKFLVKNNIKFETQKRFNDCRHKYTLPFDAYLPDYNLLIEYDGIFHYESLKFAGGMKKLKKTQMRDKIKTKYAKDNNIPLLRIPYTEFDNIEHIISTYISNNLLRK